MRGCTLKTLFIDSSRKSLSVALANEDRLLFVSNVNSYSKHSNFLMNEIVRCLKESNTNLYDVDNYIVLNGPGSFTGVRVGVTISKTLSWVLGKKMYVLNNLEALKVGVSNDVVISVIPDKQTNSYVGIYDNGTKIEEYLSIDDEKLKLENKNITIVSMEENPFMLDLKRKLEINNNVDTKVVSDYDYVKLINYALLKQSINPHTAKPIYLKKIDAEKNKNDN